MLLIEKGLLNIEKSNSQKIFQKRKKFIYYLEVKVSCEKHQSKQSFLKKYVH